MHCQPSRQSEESMSRQKQIKSAAIGHSLRHVCACTGNYLPVDCARIEGKSLEPSFPDSRIPSTRRATAGSGKHHRRPDVPDYACTQRSASTLYSHIAEPCQTSAVSSRRTNGTACAMGRFNTEFREWIAHSRNLQLSHKTPQ
jgi:hypothetical protein